MEISELRKINTSYYEKVRENDKVRVCMFLDQTNQIAENFKAIDYPQCFFIRSIKDIFENPNKIHETTSELSKFVAIEQEYKIPLSFLCLS